MSRKAHSGWKRDLSFRSIKFKIILSVVMVGVVLLFFSLWLLNDSMVMVEDKLIDDRLASDIRLMRDVLGENDGNSWSLREGSLYIGETLIGDGIREHANFEPFYHCEEVTGTFFYSFLRTFNDEVLKWVGDDITGYQQGHYLRAAGTTKGPNGEEIVGTYMDVKVANVLDREGVYSGEANVNGRMIYCRYEVLRDKDGNTVGAVVVGRSIREMKDTLSQQKTRGLILIVVMVALMAFGLSAVVSRIVGSIRLINDRLQLIGTGVFPEEPLRIKTRDELGEVADSINQMVSSLEEKERIGAELSIATDIQANMLPRVFPPFPDRDEFDIYATMRPAKEVGGDFYDFFMVDNNHLAIVIADVSGKGVPAALVMVITKILIKNYLQMGDSPKGAFTKVNHTLCDGNETGMFVTAWMGILDLETGVLTFSNAGHNPPLIKRGDGGFEYLTARHGFVLAGMDRMHYKQNELTMQPGDRLFLYTDGVTESTDSQQRLYGEERLQEYLNDHENGSAQDVLTGLLSNIDGFVGEAQQFDDITMLMLIYREKGGGTIEQ